MRMRIAVLAFLVGFSGSLFADVPEIPHDARFPKAHFPYAQAPDGCSSWGDNPQQVRDTWGPVSFVDACNTHDRCYYTWGGGFNRCNNKFFEDLNWACWKGLRIWVPPTTIGGAQIIQGFYAPPDPVRLANCELVANAMYVAVQGGAWFGIYDKAQRLQRDYEAYVATVRERLRDDRYYVSMFRTGHGYSSRSGPIAQRHALYSEVLTKMDGEPDGILTGFFNSRGRTTTEYICSEGNSLAGGQGGESREKAVNKAKENEWSHCLFRTRNGDNHQGLRDRVAVSGFRGRAWAVRAGKITEVETLRRQVKTDLGGDPDRKVESVYSSERITETEAICEINKRSDSGATIQESAIEQSRGKGSASLSPLIELAKKGRWYKCRFDVKDVGFDS